MSDTFFTNNRGPDSGTTDYIKDAFSDLSLPASNNTGLTDSAARNPLSEFFNNTDTMTLRSKTLFIKDLVLVEDRTKWVSNKPTYKIVWNETWPQAVGYVYGNIELRGRGGQPIVRFRLPNDGIGVSGNIRRIAWLVQPVQSATATGQLVLDGTNGSTIDFSGVPIDADFYPATGASGTLNNAKYVPFVHAASNEANDLHDYRLVSIQANTLEVLGAIVYYENAGDNIQVRPGVTYVDKSKISTTLGATFAVSTAGSSLGGVGVVRKTSSPGYGLSFFSITTMITTGTGSAGTIDVSTGHGGSFPVGSGIVATSGTSHYTGSVVSVSTDTLTVTPSIGFTLTGSNNTYRAWLSGPTYTINPSLLIKAHSIEFPPTFGATNPIYGVRGDYAVWGSNIGTTTIDSKSVLLFGGASGFVQVDGYFSAAEMEFLGSAINAATVSINGAPSWSLNEGQTGPIRRTLFTDAGPGWNSVRYAPAASMGLIGINRINLYERNYDRGASFGILGTFNINNTLTNRNVNSSLICLGVDRRVYAEQMYLFGSWVRVKGGTFTAGVAFIGSSTNSQIRMEYFGKDFAMVGTAASAATLTLDGAGIANTFNGMRSVSSEGFHTVTYRVGAAATCIIEAFDYAASISHVKSVQNIDNPILDYLPTVPPPKEISEVWVDTPNGFGSSGTQIRRYSILRRRKGSAITYVDDSVTGAYFIINEDGFYTIIISDVRAAGSSNVGASVNSLEISTSIYSINPNNLIITATNSAGEEATATAVVWFNRGDIVRSHGDSASSGTTDNDYFRITKIS